MPHPPYFFTQNMQVKRDTHCPVAFVLPTTRAVLKAANRFSANNEATVVSGTASAHHTAPAKLLKELSVGSPRSTLLILADQIVSPADACILVKTDEREVYFSPFEFIINTRYSYRLVIWGYDKDTVIDPNRAAIEEVLAPLADYLRSCYRLGDDWLQRDEQYNREPRVRRYNAKRKLRLFRSSVVNAFQAEPTNPVVAGLLAKVADMEQKVEGQVG